MRRLDGHDVFRALRLINEIDAEEAIKEYAAQMKGKDFSAQQLGFGIIFRLVGKLGSEQAEKLWWEFISAPMEITPEEAAALDPLEFLQVKLPELEQTIGFENYKHFFKSLVGLMK